MDENNLKSLENTYSIIKKQPPYACVLKFCKMLKNIGVDEVCDLGCGTGRHAIPMAHLGLKVLALDMSQKALDTVLQISDKENLDIEVIRCTLPKIPLQDESVNAIVSTNVIHHAKINNINNTILEIYRVLRPGGYVIVTVFSKNDYRYNTGVLLEENTFFNTIGQEKDTIHYFFDCDSLTKAFSKFDIVYEPKEIQSISSYTDLDGKTYRGTLLMGIFKKPN